jgi:hypothetical protein
MTLSKEERRAAAKAIKHAVGVYRDDDCWDSFGAASLVMRLTAKYDTNKNYVLDRIAQLQEQRNREWNALSFHVKDLLFDLSAPPRTHPFPITVNRVNATARTLYTSHKVYTPAEGETVHMPGHFEQDSPPPARIKVSDFETLFNCVKDDKNVAHCWINLTVGQEARIDAYNSLLSEIRTYFQARQHTLWMLIWHAAAGKPFDTEELQEMKAFVTTKDREADALFANA